MARDGGTTLRLAVAGVHLDGLSGAPRHLIAALREMAEVSVWALPDPAPSLARRVVMRAGRWLRQETLWEKDRGRCRTISRALDERARGEPVDAILVVGSESCAFCETSVPLFGFGDSVFGSRIDLYADQQSSRLSGATIRNAAEVQQLALDRMRVFFITSRWAWDRAVGKFGYSGRVEVTLIGANMSHLDVPPPPVSGLRLAWVGVDWIRKRGQLAVEIVAALRARGLDARLEVVGPVQVPSKPDWVTLHGRLTAGTGLSAAYGASSALLLPTEADLTPIVIAEAAMHGRTVFAPPVGGIPEMVENGVSGVLVTSEDPKVWAEAIAVSDLAALGQGARRRYDERLNWRAIARQMVERIGEAA